MFFASKQEVVSAMVGAPGWSQFQNSGSFRASWSFIRVTKLFRSDGDIVERFRET
jgi:hypothetical protein